MNNDLFIELLEIGVNKNSAQLLASGQKISRQGRKYSLEIQKQIVKLMEVNEFEDILESPKRLLKVSTGDVTGRKMRDMFGDKVDEILELLMDRVKKEIIPGTSVVDIARKILD